MENKLGPKDAISIEIQNVYTGKFECTEITPNGVVITQGNRKPIEQTKNQKEIK